jgi:hypothetical protein
MFKIIYQKNRLLTYSLISIVVFYFCFLVYQHFNDGVPSHHFLANEEYPEISNWYGIIVVCLFSSITLYTFRAKDFSLKNAVEAIIAFLYGLILFLSYSAELSAMTKSMFFGLFIIGLMYPIYRIHIYFGILLGMSYGFGAVLPTIMIGIAALLSWIIHFLILKVKQNLS